jgi:hypothetical protein
MVDSSFVRALAGCYRTDTVPAAVRLDTTPSAPGFLVRAADSDSLLGWWYRTQNDMVGVNLSAGPTLRLKQTNRATCPVMRD